MSILGGGLRTHARISEGDSITRSAAPFRTLPARFRYPPCQGGIRGFGDCLGKLLSGTLERLCADRNWSQIAVNDLRKLEVVPHKLVAR
jgi:hypothetical protein